MHLTISLFSKGIVYASIHPSIYPYLHSYSCIPTSFFYLIISLSIHLSSYLFIHSLIHPSFLTSIAHPSYIHTHSFISIFILQLLCSLTCSLAAALATCYRIAPCVDLTDSRSKCLLISFTFAVIKQPAFRDE